MPDLLHSLQGCDLGHLRIVAELCGIELQSKDARDVRQELAAAVLDGQLAGELISALNAGSSSALTALAQAGGRIPWAVFIRQFGEIREMGAGQRDRTKPYLKPVSAAEALFYRALLGRAFLDTQRGAEEFAYIPDDLLPIVQRHLPKHTPAIPSPFGHPAIAPERAHSTPASDRILDDATTLLAALRVGHPVKPDPVLSGLLLASGVLKGNTPRAEKVRTFLEQPRREAMQTLVSAWQASTEFNELRLMPGLIIEGRWNNRPVAARKFILDLLDGLPKQTWWNLSSFISHIKLNHPDFQRPAGDYDSWFIKSAENGRYLRGFADWEHVDGALIRFLLTQVMHRLGMLDLASPGAGMDPSAFRIVPALDRLARSPGSENGKLHVTPQGSVLVPRSAPRAVRYQLARFCEWEDEKPDTYRYRINPVSLGKSAEQGLKVEQLLTLLTKHSDSRLPAAVVAALKRWEAHGVEARTEVQVVLRVSRPEILKELRKSKAARFLGEPLGPTTVVVKRGAQARVIAALVELGLLAQDNTAELIREENSVERHS